MTLQKLFLAVVSFKIVSAAVGLKINDPWIFGLALPILAMLYYCFAGWRMTDRGISLERFADTCYYLGFIFTIFSILISLLDFSKIGSNTVEIAVRFGAAMISTVLGLGARVLLVSFKPESDTAISTSENAVMEAASRFREQLLASVHQLDTMSANVEMTSAKASQRLAQLVETSSKIMAEKMTAHFTELSDRSRAVAEDTLKHFNEAAKRLDVSADEYAVGIKANMQKLDSDLVGFSEAVSMRLAQTPFPDDFFAQKLDLPISELAKTAILISTQVKVAADEIGKSANELAGTMKILRTKGKSAEAALETVSHLGTLQHALFESAQAQILMIRDMTAAIGNLDQSLSTTASRIEINSDASVQLSTGLAAIISEGERSRGALTNSLDVVTTTLESSTSAFNKAAARMDRQILVNERLMDKLDAQASSATANTRSIDRLENTTSDMVRGINQSISELKELLPTKAVSGGQYLPGAPIATALGNVEGHELKASQEGRVLTPIEIAALQRGASTADVTRAAP